MPKIIRQKLAVDLSNSVLDGPRRCQEATEALAKACAHLGASVKDRFAPGRWIPSETSSAWFHVPQEALSVIGSKLISVSCCCTTTAELAALIHLRDEHNLNLEIDYRDGSALQQISRLKEERKRYDFLVTGAFSHLYEQHAAITCYLHLLVSHVDCQYILGRQSRLNEIHARLAKANRLFFIPRTANEALLPKLPVPSDSITEIALPDLRSLPGKMDDGDFLLAWEPNASVLARQFSLSRLSEAISSVPVTLCANKRVLASNARLVSAMVQCIVGAMNYLHEHPKRAEEHLLALPEIITRFAQGATALTQVEQHST